MFSEIAIKVENLSKCYQIYDQPHDRLKQFILPRIQGVVGQMPKQYYKEFWALKDVSFQIKKGETVGVIGRNGSGKSTLLQLICGTLNPTSGVVSTKHRIAALLELGSGFNPEFTGVENLRLNCALLGLSDGEIDQQFDKILAFSDIGEFINQPLKTYSSGMYVRLAFAIAINSEPDILIVDEALAVGDEAFQRKCFARIEFLRSRGATILFVSHSAQTIVQLCDRAILLDRGEMILDGIPKKVVGQYQRFINASSGSAESIRNHILSMRNDDIQKLSDDRSEGAGEIALSKSDLDTHEDYSFGSVNNIVLKDFYDSNLISQSVMALEERGACIRDARITTLNGELINILSMGKRYVFEYFVDFRIAVKEVGFACGVRTPSGLLLAGASTYLSKRERIPSIDMGTTKYIRFEFTCNFVPGTYFWLCGTRGNIDSEEVLLHRIEDIYCCRVVDDEGIGIVTGHFDANMVANIF